MTQRQNAIISIVGFVFAICIGSALIEGYQQGKRAADRWYADQTLQEDWNATQKTLDIIRRCDFVLTQREKESWESFIARANVTGDHGCYIFKKSVQFTPTGGLDLGAFKPRSATFMGGSFGGIETLTDTSDTIKSNTFYKWSKP